MTGATLADRLHSVGERVQRAAERSGRPAEAVRLMAVTKTFPRAAVEEALREGLSLFGENRVQEAEEKYTGLEGAWELHLIGHLQRNKARAASALFRCVQSIDKRETAEALSRACAARGALVEVLLEMNTSGEQSKSGFTSRDDLLRGLDQVLELPHLSVRGLMTVGPLTDEPRRIRESFSLLGRLFREVQETRSPAGFAVLSMGMSGDFETAVEEGSTLIRLGTALFGSRSLQP
jgi:PLP dependent protein